MHLQFHTRIRIKVNNVVFVLVNLGGKGGGKAGFWFSIFVLQTLLQVRRKSIFRNIAYT